MYAVDQSIASLRDIIARRPVESTALANMLFEPEKYRLQRNINGRWVSEATDTLEAVFLMASITITQAKLAIGQEDSEDGDDD